MNKSDVDGWQDRNLVYGQIGDSVLVFIPRSKAVELSQTYDALRQSKTWADLRDRMPKGAWEEFFGMLSDEDNDYYTLERFLEEERENSPDVSEEQAVARFRNLKIGERLPLDDDLFDRSKTPYLEECDWPESTERAMLDWVPESIQRRFGTVGLSMVSGHCLEFRPSDAAEIVKELESSGFVCVEDDGSSTAHPGSEVRVFPLDGKELRPLEPNREQRTRVIDRLRLREPIFRMTTNYGHFGRPGLPWEI